MSKADYPETFCKDCGLPTMPGAGSARCPQCWDDRLGPSFEHPTGTPRTPEKNPAS